MMVRILSVLPAVVGVVCALLVIGSLYSPALDPSRTNVPLVPCTDDTAGCPVGLTNEDLSAPTAFMLLEIELTIEWNKSDSSWIGVIESPPPSGCEPDSNGLTACTADDFEFVAGGDSAVNAQSAQSAENAGQKKDGEEKRVEEEAVNIVVKIELFIFII